VRKKQWWKLDSTKLEIMRKALCLRMSACVLDICLQGVLWKQSWS